MPSQALPRNGNVANEADFHARTQHQISFYSLTNALKLILSGDFDPCSALAINSNLTRHLANLNVSTANSGQQENHLSLFWYSIYLENIQKILWSNNPQPLPLPKVQKQADLLTQRPLLLILQHQVGSILNLPRHIERMHKQHLIWWIFGPILLDHFQQFVEDDAVAVWREVDTCCFVSASKFSFSSSFLLED